MPTFEESNRYYLGEIVVPATAPSGVPAASATVLENLMEFAIPLGSTLPEAETRRARANVLLITFEFATITEEDVAIWFSRKNPAPYDYSPETDSDPDSWISYGAQEVFETPTLVGGNAFQARVNGARFVTLQRLNGSSGTLTAKLYALADRLGGW
jgi:hypothetical protein